MAKADNWNWGVGGIVLRGEEILLVRHTYGAAKGKLLIPGGYLQTGETPQAAAIREIYEETKITASVKALAGIRFQAKNWYAVFLLGYVSGQAQCDGDETDFAGFVPIREAAGRSDVTGLSLQIVRAAAAGIQEIPLNPYFSGDSREAYTLYGLTGEA